ncbi:MAG: dienelactone hydrolase family protein [Planctomycetaceae bacterium]|nr:dienelactone hydrolase family protein [Planctomycetaceae bacterium]
MTGHHRCGCFGPFAAGMLLVTAGMAAEPPELGAPLPGTAAFTLEGDISEHMIRGVDRFLLQKLRESIDERAAFWHRDLSSHQSYARSVAANREHLRTTLGLHAERPPCTSLELLATTERSAVVGQGAGYEVLAVRWPADDGLHGEGLLLRPTGREPLASIIALPDCEQSPEMLCGLEPGMDAAAQFARRFAESGCQVLVPMLINRGMELSVIAAGQRPGKVTHREILYRPAYQMGRHLIGYEVQKVLAAVDWCALRDRPIAVVGYGEGGMISLYAGALDERIDAVGVSGYFHSRQTIWEEPIDRNVFGLLREFGDAELASLVVPRSFIVEASAFPTVEIPSGVDSAPASITSPTLMDVEAEFARAGELVAGLQPAARMEFVESNSGGGLPGTEAFLQAVLTSLGINAQLTPNNGLIDVVEGAEPSSVRLSRQFHEISEYNERLVSDGPLTRAAFTSKIDRETSDIATFAASTESYRDYLRNEIIGRFDVPLSDPQPQTHLLYDDPQFLGYEVIINVVPDVILYGTLLLPRDLKPGEQRPVVVCQHGLEGRTEFAVTGDKTSYRDFAARLARRGFITFAPQHLYRGGDLFRTLQRKANPLGKSLFALMILQHEQLLRWLASLPGVDPQRIAFYGISYGGKSAMRIPGVLDGYCLSICSSDFSDWIWRTVSNRFNSGYLAHAEYEIFEFGLGSTFNYGDLAALICPRPFMVEDFHHHGIAADRARGEYGRVELLYENLGIADRTRYTHYAGWNPPAEHGDRETFDFLHEQLAWPLRD